MCSLLDVFSQYSASLPIRSKRSGGSFLFPIFVDLLQNPLEYAKSKKEFTCSTPSALFDNLIIAEEVEAKVSSDVPL